ncbi:MAG: helix-turn-helix domain-containing protein [Bacteroidales bacterium]|nr:helix-turn-helix domain-containing protein [Bacteroidales bacterium]
MNKIENPLIQLAHDFVQYTNRNVFLTGKAGTGKTTFLHDLRKKTPKRMVVVAPTGVAAINAGGVTIHSFFQLSFGPQISHLIEKKNEETGQQDSYVKRFSREKINLIKSIDLLVIDEISMVRADMLDAVDEVLRRYRNRNKPFGGVQLLMIGDLHQLSPVIKDEEWRLLKSHYNSVYFFDSKALQQTNPVNIELEHIYRQSDKFFIDILGKIRNNIADKATLDILNSRYLPGFKPSDDEGYIVLTTHNVQAQEINKEKLNEIKTMPSSFDAVVEGDFPEYNFPTEKKLELKVGAQVMFVKNDSKREKLFYNGKIGKIKSIEDDTIFVKSADDHAVIPVERETWQNVKFVLNDETKEIDEEILGSFTQFPLKLAWAITIHKSQGLTFEKAIIDAGAAFAFGQVYVALSRCRSFEGMILRSPITAQCIKKDKIVTDFTEEIVHNKPDDKQLQDSKINFQQELIYELFSFTDLQKRFYRLRKTVNENASIIDNSVLSLIKDIETNSKSMIYDVVEKFHKQLKQLMLPDVLPELDKLLQERIKKASPYFIEKLTEIFTNGIKEANFNTDNKAVNKNISEDIAFLMKEVFVKTQCLKKTVSVFNSVDYLKTKADADVDFKPQAFTKQVKSDSAFIKNIPHAELFSMLCLWRQSVADIMDVPIFVVLPKKTLAKLLVELPANKAELLKIKGIGKVKVKQYGDEILEIINDYCLEKGILRKEPEPELPVQVKDKSHAVSYKLFKEGMSVSEIAKHRNFSESTIEGHLSHYVANGEIDLYRLMDKGKADMIIQFIEENQVQSVTQAKYSLGDDVSFSEIKFVINYLKYKEENKT